MFSSIVVGTDGSPTAGEAVRQATEMAKCFGGTVHLVSAYKTMEAVYAAPEMGGAVMAGFDPRKEAEQVLAEAADKVKAEGVAVEAYACPGDAASALIDVAESQKADVIVVGNRGMSGRARFLLGSIPNKVSHHSPCSVLIAHTT